MSEPAESCVIAEDGPSLEDLIREAEQRAKQEQPEAIIERARVEDIASRNLARARRIATDAQTDLQKRMAAALIPARYAEYSLDTFPAPEGSAEENAVRMCRSYVASWRSMRKSGAGMVFLGQCGRGKTGLACAVLNAIIAQYPATGMVRTQRGIVRHISDTWGRKGKTEQEALSELTSVDLLVADDIGKSAVNDHELRILCEVLDERHANRMPTIVTTNLTIRDQEIKGKKFIGIESFLGVRTFERITEDRGQFIACNWGQKRNGLGSEQ